MSLRMRQSDLGELYALLTMYQRVYGGIGDGLLSEIADNYNRAAARFCCGNGGEGVIPPVTNPRGAGRKRRDIPGETEKILQLRRSGMSIRAIASEMSYSVGRVHKLIHEHSSKTAK